MALGTRQPGLDPISGFRALHHHRMTGGMGQRRRGALQPYRLIGPYI